MRRVNQAAGLAFLVGSVLVMWESRNLEYYTSLGPGPGFFPFWLSAVLALLSVIWLVQVSRQPSEPIEEGFVPSGSALLRISSILVALALTGLLMETLGFQLVAFLFLLFLLLALGRQNVGLTMVIALAGSFGLYHIFTGYLDVPLPTSTIQLLANLGL